MYSVTVTNGACTATDTVNITLHAIPVLSLGPDMDLCQGATASLHGNVTGSYTWSTGETTDSIQVTQGGFYSATVTDANGCMDSDTVQVNVVPVPVFSLGADTTACDSITLSASGGITYEWQDGSTLSTYTATGSGTYSVTVTNAGGCQASDEINVTINVSPSAGFSFDTTGCPDVVFTNLSSGTSPNYDWDFGDGMGTSTDPDPTYTYDSNGTYVVVLTAMNTCGTATFTDTVGIDCYPNGIELPETEDWKVYPNPASDLLIIESAAGTKPALWSLYDFSGRLLRQGKVSGSTQLSLQGISAGAYILHISNGETRKRTPVVVVR
jgi:PKD repeat protein